MRLTPELMQFEIGISIKRYLPPMGTAGFERLFVNGYKRLPCPPPKIRQTILIVPVEAMTENI
jgi:hypothetical protein